MPPPNQEVRMENSADPLLAGGHGVPPLNNQERDAVIRIGLEGGKLARHLLGRAVLAALLRSQVVAPGGPGMVELTALGVRVLAEAAKAVTRDV
jgi:hypothetical protein